jgi:hypothetical protein
MIFINKDVFIILMENLLLQFGMKLNNVYLQQETDSVKNLSIIIKTKQDSFLVVK